MSSSSFFVRAYIMFLGQYCLFGEFSGFWESVRCKNRRQLSQDSRVGQKQKYDAVHTYIMNRMSFSNVRAPQLILLGEPELKSICWEIPVDVIFVTTAITGMDPNYFAKQFFDCWYKGLVSW